MSSGDIQKTGLSKPEFLSVMRRAVGRFAPLFWSQTTAYVRLFFDRWVKLCNRLLVMTGHTAKEHNLDVGEASTQLGRFLTDYKPPKKLVGLNYWHFGATPADQLDLLAAAPGPF